LSGFSEESGSDKMRTPVFFVVGAQKAGTTSLHDWLAQQPDVCLPTLKETHYFSHDQRYEKGLDWYMRQFPRCADGSVVGEVDPEYMYHACAPERIAEVCPEAKIVFILRSPLERAYSQYLMSVRRGLERLSFYDALASEDERTGPGADPALAEHLGYMGRGRYAAQIARFRKALPGGSFLIVKFDELVSGETGAGTYGRICRFIGLGSSPSIADRSRKSNVASEPRSGMLADILYGRSLPKRALKLLLPSHDMRMKLWAMANRFNEKPVEKSAQGKRPVAVPGFIVGEIERELRLLKEAEGLECADWLERTLGGDHFVFTDAPPQRAHRAQR